MAQVVGLGGTTGLGSIIYGLQKVSEILDETHLSVRALEFSRLITKELINQDLRHDVVAGNAGGILGLLYLYKATREGQLLKKAILCGEHLLKKRKPTPLNYRTWEFQKGMFLVGFSHGSSGILYALAQLYKITKNNELYKALLEVLDYENAVFSQGDNNWPDFRTDPANTTAISWCHGATGVGFSRLGLLDIIKTPQIRKDLDIALEKTLEKDMGFVDTLCCGNFGRLDFLVSSGLLLKKGDLVKLVEQQTSRVLNRYDTTGEFNYFSNYSTSETNIGFYQGISGIGYEMLRICEPGLFGSILMWE